MSEADRIQAGITEVNLTRTSILLQLKVDLCQDLIRISVGTESINDIMADFSKALDAIPSELMTTQCAGSICSVDLMEAIDNEASEKAIAKEVTAV